MDTVPQRVLVHQLKRAIDLIRVTGKLSQG